MTGWLRPIPMSGIEQGDLLAGQSHVRFNRVARLDTGEVIAAQDLEPEILARLTKQPAPCAGLIFDRPRIMGILNVTPDSFSDGGTLGTLSAAVERAVQMARDADLLDIGGESTRPGAAAVPVDEEIRRTAPVIRAIRDAGLTLPISIDTRKAPVAEAALDAGADIVNDVSAFAYDPELADLVAERDVPVCLMHSKGDPATMQDDPRYDDVLVEVLDALSERIDFALSRGIARDKIIVDPGIGFAKTGAHNLTLLRGLSAFHNFGLPVLLGASRKRFIGTISGAQVARDRVPGSLAVALQGVAQGMQMLRVHDVAETAQAVRLWLAMSRPGPFVPFD